MHFAILRSATLFLFALFTLSSALPAVGQNENADLTARGSGNKSKPRPKPKSPSLKRPTRKPPKNVNVKAKPKPGTQGSAGTKPHRDGQVSVHYKPTIRVRSEDILDTMLYVRDPNTGLDARAAALDNHPDGTSSEDWVHQRSVGDALDIVFTELQARKGGGGLGEAIAEGVKLIVDVIKAGVQKDNDAREKFTKETVANGRSKFPAFNWVICHVKHTTNFWGEKGKDWGHQHAEFDIKIGGTIGYEIYWFRNGTFSKQGDGGYINWAWSGFPKEVSKDGATITFNTPP